MMIITVTLNPALDQQIMLDSFAPGTIQWYSQGIFLPGGKGVNVSRLLSSLGMENKALGIAAGFTGREILRLLEKEGCKTDFVLLEEGNSRINVKLRTAGGEETALNGTGPRIPEEAVDQLLEKLTGLTPEDVVVLSGSLPEGLPETAFPRILEAARRAGVRLVVDMAGDSLLATLPYHPYLIKPNDQELREIFSLEEPLTAQDVKEYAGQLQRMGAKNVVVSLGAKGALLREESGRCMFCHGVRGRAVSTVGAGDSLVAGFLYGLELHGTMEGALKWGVAAGAATAFQEDLATGEQVKARFPAVGNPHIL